jgi:small subunit ribosomal protein S18
MTNSKTDKQEIKTEFSYKDYEELRDFMNDRGRIIGRKRTGLNLKQQRSLTTAIKRARFLGLLLFNDQRKF